MPRALWKGAISFGLVNIPVGLYSAEDRKEMSFSMLDRRDMSPVGYHRVNKESGKEVPWKEIVKGYEYRKGKYVVLTDEDFRRANVKATQTVDIVGFVEASEIPPIYFDSPYYLAPEKRGEKAYALLREALRQSGKVGVASVVIRKRQHLAAVIPLENILVLDTMRYHDELKAWSSLDVPAEGMRSAKLNQKEVDMALRLIEEMSEDWKPQKYKDTYREDILARIKQKVKAGDTEEVTEPEEEEKPQKAEIIDLMSLLKKSVEGQGRAAKPAAASHRRPAARRARPATKQPPRARPHPERRRHA
jgi:DNA end-binding protein Ku